MAVVLLIIMVVSLLPTDVFAATNTDLSVHYIDVGQGDSILLKNDGKTMLIDAGDNITKNNVVLYLQKQKVKKLDYIIATHPHADHIGKLDDVINEFSIGKIFMPKVPNKYVPTTKTYEDVLKAIKSKGLKITGVTKNISFDFGDAKVELLYQPNSDSNLNNYSIITKVTHGKKKFLFMGDAEQKMEKKLYESKTDIDCDVLKVGHHGSKYSSNSDFIEAVSPDMAIISVAQKNRYDHPHKETVDLFSRKKIKTYQTKDSGTIKITSNGKDLKVVTQIKPAKSISEMFYALISLGKK